MRPNFYQRRAVPNLGKLPSIFGRLARYGTYALIAYSAYIYAKHTLDCHRATRLATTAREELRLGEPITAREILKEALSLCPENAEAARIMAGLLDAEGSPQAFAYHSIVLDSDAATMDDRMDMIDSALRHTDEPGALEKALEVAQQLDDPALPHLIRARIHAKLGEEEEREAQLRRAIAKRPASDTWRALADALVSRREQGQTHASEALDLMKQAAQSDNGADGLLAIETALESGLIPNTELDAWLEMLRSHPAADTLSQLKAASLALERKPAAREAILTSVTERARGLSANEKIAVARWLLAQDAASLVRAFWSPAEAASGGKTSFLAWLDAASAAGDRKGVEDALRDSSNPLGENLTLALRANATLARGDTEEAISLANAAISACGSDGGARLEVLRIFLEGGNFPAALTHLHTLSGDSFLEAAAAGELITLACRGHGAGEALAFHEALLAIPGGKLDMRGVDRMDRLRLTLGGDVQEDVLQERMKAHPADPSPRLTLALAHLLQGRTARAGYELELLDDDTPHQKLAPHDRIVVAVLMAANGRSTQARSLSSDINPSDVTREEFDLLKRFLQGAPD